VEWWWYVSINDQSPPRRGNSWYTTHHHTPHTTLETRRAWTYTTTKIHIIINLIHPHASSSLLLAVTNTSTTSKLQYPISNLQSPISFILSSPAYLHPSLLLQYREMRILCMGWCFTFRFHLPILYLSYHLSSYRHYRATLQVLKYWLHSTVHLTAKETRSLSLSLSSSLPLFKARSPLSILRSCAATSVQEGYLG